MKMFYEHKFFRPKYWKHTFMTLRTKRAWRRFLIGNTDFFRKHFYYYHPRKRRYYYFNKFLSKTWWENRLLNRVAVFLFWLSNSLLFLKEYEYCHVLQKTIKIDHSFYEHLFKSRRKKGFRDITEIKRRFTVLPQIQRLLQSTSLQIVEITPHQKIVYYKLYDNMDNSNIALIVKEEKSGCGLVSGFFNIGEASSSKENIID